MALAHANHLVCLRTPERRWFRHFGRSALGPCGHSARPSLRGTHLWPEFRRLASGTTLADPTAKEIAMISPALRVILLVGLLSFPAASVTIAIPGGAALSHTGPIMCGPGPDC
jgi:hypothetical protein